MKLQCKDGILDTGTAEFSKYNQERMRFLYLPLSRENRSRAAEHCFYSTPCTVENARAVLEAQLRKEARIAAEGPAMRVAWLNGLTDDELTDMENRLLGANMMIPDYVEREMVKRGLHQRIVADTTTDFAQYVEARNRAEREGRLDDFEDGIS